MKVLPTISASLWGTCSITLAIIGVTLPRYWHIGLLGYAISDVFWLFSLGCGIQSIRDICAIVRQDAFDEYEDIESVQD